MIKYKKIGLFMLVGFLLSVIIIVGFYVRQQNYSDWVQQEYGIDNGQYNAIKHSSAAADLYMGLRYIGFSNNFTASTIDQFGKINERVEQAVRNKDSTLEMMKDMYNNGVGVNTAYWFSQKDKNCLIKFTSPAQVLIILTEHNILANSPEQLRWQTHPLKITRHSKSLAQAIEWYDSKRIDIKNLVFSFLDQNFCHKINTSLK